MTKDSSKNPNQAVQMPLAPQPAQPKLIVSGGSSGIGRATVIKALTEGAKVCYSYRNNHPPIDSPIDAMDICGNGGAASKEFPAENLAAIRCDMRDSKQVDDFVEEAVAFMGGLDYVVANSGAALHQYFDSTDDASYHNTFASNMDACFYLCRAAAKYLLRQKSGSILTLSSVWGLNGASFESIYAASKAAIIGFSKSLAAELGPSGIRVNCICPGVIDTPMLRKNLSSAAISQLSSDIPMGRIGQAKEVASLIWFICREATYCNASVITCDGGFAP